MTRTFGILLGVALLSFAAGFWTKATLATQATVSAPSTISPAELHLKINPSSLPQTQADAF
jgi:hypothetical protein